MKKAIILILISIFVSMAGVWSNPKAAEWVTDLEFVCRHAQGDV